jgi:hypothetical protein
MSDDVVIADTIPRIPYAFARRQGLLPTGA